MSAFTELYSLNNLRLAWKRVRTGQNIAYKQYFREVYDAYGLALDLNLKCLSESIKLSTYSPSKPQRIMIPKASGLQRPITLLAVQDQVVLQAIANIFASKLRHKKIQVDRTVTCSNRINLSGSKEYFFERWQDSFSLFKQRVYKHYQQGNIYCADFDLTSFYDTISHDLLIRSFSPRGGNYEFCQFVSSCLRKWTPNNYSHGIPQGPIASDFLAECIMLDIDLEMQKLTRYVRYVDDIRILGTNELEVLKGINILDTLTRKKGLIPHSGKYGMRKANSKYEAIGKLPSLSSGRTGQNSFTQKRLIATFYKSLSKKKDAILDISSFKFSIYRLYPNEQILNCIMRLIPRYPDLIDLFVQYLVKFGERRKISNYLLRLISRDNPFSYIEGKYWECFSVTASDKQIAMYCTTVLNKLNSSNEDDIGLRLGIYKVLNRSRDLPSLRLYYKSLLNEPSYVLQGIILPLVPNIFPNLLAFIRLLRKNLESQSIDSSLVAAWYIGLLNINMDKLSVNYTSLTEPAKNTLDLLGFQSRLAKTKTDSLGILFSRRFNLDIWVKWKKLLGKDYKQCHRLFVMSENSFSDSPSTWMACLDSFNDLVTRNLLDFLRSKFPTVRVPNTSNVNGLIDFGVLLDPTGYLSRTVPRFHNGLRDFHIRRNSLPTSHAKDKRTQKDSKALKFIDRNNYLLKIQDSYRQLFHFLSTQGF